MFTDDTIEAALTFTLATDAMRAFMSAHPDLYRSGDPKLEAQWRVLVRGHAEAERGLLEVARHELARRRTAASARIEREGAAE